MIKRIHIQNPTSLKAMLRANGFSRRSQTRSSFFDMRVSYNPICEKPKWIGKSTQDYRFYDSITGEVLFCGTGILRQVTFDISKINNIQIVYTYSDKNQIPSPYEELEFTKTESLNRADRLSCSAGESYNLALLFLLQNLDTAILPLLPRAQDTMIHLTKSL